MDIRKVNFGKFTPLILVVGLAAFLRFYNLSQSFVFTIDEEYLTTFAQTIIDDFHILWIGMSISNGFYLGPLWIYITAFFLSLSQSNPLVLAYVAASIGVVSTFMVFIAGWKMFNYKVGIIASLLYASSPLIVFFDQRYWNDTPLIFLSLIMLFSLSRTFKSPNWWVVFAAAFGFMFHVHLSIFPYFFLAGYLFIGQFRRIPKKIIALSIGVFLLLYSPLVVFDYFHNFDNLTLPIRLIKSHNGNSTEGSISDRGQVFFQMLGRLYYLKPFAFNVDENHWGCTTLSKSGVPAGVDKTSTHTIPPSWLSAISLGVLIWFLCSRTTWKVPERKILALALVAIVASFLLISSGAMEYYLLGAFPLLVFLPALFISDLSRLWQRVGYGLAIIVAGLGFFTVSNTNPALGIGSQRETVKEVMKVIGNDSFELKELGGCRGYAGWRYLFQAFGRTPSHSSIDSTFGWLYPKKISQKAVKYSVIVVESRALPGINYPNAQEITQGGFKAFILKND